MPQSQYIQSMFDDIATKYDSLNDILSLGIHRRWKKSFVQDSLDLSQSVSTSSLNILDCATGTGDIAFTAEKYLQKTKQANYRIRGCDFSANMLDIARKRGRKNNSQVCFEKQDLCNLTYSDQSFDIAMVSFGMRNVENLPAALGELSRVSSSLHILEFGQPRNALLSSLYFSLSRLYIPLFGTVTKRKDAYRYLVESSSQFPSGQIFCELINKHTHYTKIHFRTYMSGVVYSYHCQGD